MSATNSTVATGDRGVHAITTSANIVDSVTFTARDCDAVEVLSDGAADLYVTVDGSTPTVAGNNTDRLPAGAPSVRVISVPTSGATEVQLKSSGTVKYSVTEAI